MSNFISKENWIVYKGKTVWAMFPETKTKSHARLLGYNNLTEKYVMKCGIHDRVFECPEIAEINDPGIKYK